MVGCTSCTVAFRMPPVSVGCEEGGGVSVEVGAAEGNIGRGVGALVGPRVGSNSCALVGATEAGTAVGETEVPSTMVTFSFWPSAQCEPMPQTRYITGVFGTAMVKCVTDEALVADGVPGEMIVAPVREQDVKSDSLGSCTTLCKFSDVKWIVSPTFAVSC